MLHTKSPPQSYHVETAPKQYWTLICGEQSTLIMPLLLFCLLYLGFVVTILILNNGQFTYTLDDAYIHLALAENIARGHYGVNLFEMSAPSSSILWPILLAPVARLSWGYLAPLAINLVASIGVLIVFHTLVSESFTSFSEERKNEATTIMVVFLMLATNLLGLAFTGMEHSLQLLCAATMVLGLIRERQSQRVTWWFAAVLVLGPLIRYENMCLSAPALVYLCSRKQHRVAVSCGTLLVFLMVGFSWFLYISGLGILPTSIFAKMNFAANTGSGAFVVRIFQNVFDRQGALLLLGMLLLLTYTKSDHRYLARWAIAATVLHMLLGKFGWYSRYEMYIWCVMLLVLIYLYGDVLVRNIFNHSDRQSAVIIMVATVVLCMLGPIVKTT